MKVPTYTAQSAIPRQGQGQFLTARLDASAMSAPARAFASQGEQMAQFGQKIADFGYKRAEIGAESEAAEAATKAQVELASAEAAALQNPNMSSSVADYEAKSRLIIEKYKSGLSNSLARSAFSSKALELQARSSISFNKANNARVLEARKTGLDATTQDRIKIVVDPSMTSIARMTAAAEAISEIDGAAGDLGAEDVAARRSAAYENMVAGTVNRYMAAPNSDTIGIATALREGRIKDPIVQGALANLTEEQRAKVASSALQEAKRIVAARKEQREAAEEAANAGNDQMYRGIVNTDFSNLAQREIAKRTLDTLKRANYFDSPDKLRAVEKLFGDDGTAGSSFAEQSAETDAVEADLREKESLDELTYDELSSSRSRVTASFYAEMLKTLEGERNEAKKDGEDMFRKAYKYSEYADKGALADPSRQAFNKAALQLNEYIADNPKASRKEVREEAKRIIRETEAAFLKELRSRRQESIRAAYSKLTQALRARIPAPTADNFEEFKQAVARELAAGGNSLILEGINRLVTQEIALQAID